MLIALLLAMTLDDVAVTKTAASDPATAAPSSGAAASAQVGSPPSPGLLRLPKPKTEPARALRFVWRDHPSLRAGRNFRVDFAAKIQQDARDPGDEPTDFPTWELHRLRIGVEGELFRRIQFSIERELSENETNDPLKKATKSQWKDVFVEANISNAFQVRVGKFKVPYGLDQTSGESNLDFVYRSLGGSNLSPGRDIGVMVHGRFFHRALNYSIGGFQQDGDNSRSGKIAGADTTIAARVTVAPFRKIKAAGLGAADIGVSFATSQLSDEPFLPNGLRARTVMSQYTFFEPVFVKGTRRRYGVDADWSAGPIGARSEYIFVSDTRQDQGLGDQDLSNVRGRAWYALATWVVTGEKKVRPVEARKGGLGRGGMGAIELALRVDRLWFDSKKGLDTPFRNSRSETIFPNTDKVTTIGLNWYLNRWAKLQVNALHEQTTDVERSPTADGSAFWSKVFRLQLEL